jgi:hypothetical protein
MAHLFEYVEFLKVIHLQVKMKQLFPIMNLGLLELGYLLFFWVMLLGHCPPYLGYTSLPLEITSFK